MKRQRLLFSLLMAIVMMAFSPTGAWAVALELQEAPANVIELKAGDNNVVIENPTSGNEWSNDTENPAHYTLFKYTVKADGDVTIKSVGGLDTYGTLYDASMNFIKYNDDDGDGSNFKLVISDAKAGDVYCIGARGYGSTVPGNYIINVEAPLPECAPGAHALTLHEGMAATCTTAGSKTYYECSKCEKMFADKEGTEEITDVIIPALGHDLDADDKCQREGCDYSIPLLVAGDNNVVILNPTSGGTWDNDRENPEYYTIFKYVATGHGTVTITSVGGADTFGALFDANMVCLETNDYYQDKHDFRFYIDAKAGEVYYIGARGYWDVEVGNYIINVVAPPPACAPGEHVMTLHKGVAATCTTAGSKTYYECSKCNGTYADAQGTEVISDIDIPALGHDFGEDGNCSHAGCDVKMVVKVLKTGDNNVVIENPTTSEEWTEDRENSEHYILFTYTVKADGDITFRSVGGDDTYCVLYDSSMEYLDCSDGNEENDYLDFVLVRNNVKAGEVYYLGVRGYGNHVIGDYIICVEAILPECAPGEHELTPHEGVAATCTTAGTKAYYECSKCEKMFADEEGTEEIADLVIPALGHDLDADGKCQREGCDYSNLLVAGDNNVVIENPTPSQGDWWDSEDEDRCTPLHYTLYRLVAEEDNDITIRSVGGEDTYGVLYDANLNLITNADGNEDDLNDFKLVQKGAKAGEVYYVGARWYDDHAPAEYVINVTYAPVEDDGPVGPVDAYGDLMVNGKTIDLTDFEAVEAFNSENDGTIHIDGTIIANQPHYVLQLNNAEINVKANTDEEADGDMDKKPDAGIIYAGNVPLIVELTGKNTINIAGAEETAVGIVAMSELMFTGSGSLDVNCTDGTAPLFIGIEAKDMIAYDKQTASMYQFPMDLSFSGSININGKAQKVALGMGAINDMLLFSGEYNINTESAQNNIELDLSMMTTGIFAGGNIAFIDTKVKINSSKKGILLVGGDDDDDDPNAEPPVYEPKKLMPMKSSRKAKAGSKSQSPLMAKAKAGKKKVNVMGTPPYDFWVEGADVEIEAADGAISSLRQNLSWGPRVADGGTMHLTIGTSKENAETQDVIFSEDGCTDLDLFAETSGMNYVHIYETGEATMDVELFDGEEKRNDYLKIVVGHIEGCDTYSAMFFNYGPAYFNFTLHRTFKNDGWYTLCLPFDLEVAGSPFSKAAHFAGVDISGVQFSFGFNTVDKMHAGIPYLVKVDHEVMNPEFKNMKLVNYMPSYESHVAELPINGSTMTYAFNGCYDPVETFDHYFAGLGSDNMMKVIADGTKIRGFRGFFTESATYEQLVNGGNTGGGGPIEIEAKKMTFTINGEIEGAATDIDPDLHVERNAGNDKTYNVMGQRVNKNAKGLIIRNGKTIFKK